MISRFDRPAGGGRQLLRVMPCAIAGVQQLRGVKITVTPQPLEERRFTDFFGTEVIEVVMPAQLTQLEVRLDAEVERLPRGRGLDVSPRLAALAGLIDETHSLAPRSPHHFLPASPCIPAVAEITDFARRSMAHASSIVEAIEAIGLALHRSMRFDARATEVDTPIAEAFAGRRGVCQDFAQIMISALRGCGIPAGYVAGYLRTLPPPGRARLIGADAMHAWITAWAGPQMGWVEYDATNACWVDEDHIVAGYGRDYSDVAPVTGTWRLDGAQSGTHLVDIVEITE